MRQTAVSFPLGPIVATAAAVAEIPLLAIHGALDRHAAGDWGDLCWRLFIWSAAPRTAPSRPTTVLAISRLRFSRRP